MYALEQKQLAVETYLALKSTRKTIRCLGYPGGRNTLMKCEYSGPRDTSVRSFGNRRSGKQETDIPMIGNHHSGYGNHTGDILELWYAP